MSGLRATLVVLVAANASFAQPAGVLRVAADELNRNFAVLKAKADPPPYFISYSIVDEDTYLISAQLGALTANRHSQQRGLDVSVRVGSPKLDNYHQIGPEGGRMSVRALLSIENNPGALKHRIWLETDRAYRAARARLIQIQTNAQVKAASEDASGDFSSEQPVVYAEAPPPLKFAVDQWAGRLRSLSSVFSQYPSILSSSVTVVAQRQVKYLVNTDGSEIQHGRGYARIVVAAQGKAEDGMDLATTDTFEAVQPDGLPDEKKVRASIEKVASGLTALAKAPAAEPFVGPAILSGAAAGVFFHEIFGHRVEGHRQKDESEGQTFTKSLGSLILPEFLSVTFDPTRKKSSGEDLNGWYLFDDEGVKSRPVPVVESGILKTFLLSRTPIKGFPASNGHGRRQAGMEVVARQSNLIVESRKMVSDARLRDLLIEEVKRQNKPYGLYFQQITGGFTTTARRGLQAFKVIPLVVYRVYPDGRPDELIRGVDVVGTPLTSFAKILATSDRSDVFNGYCGAESGSVPVSAVSPALLISEIEVEKKPKSQDRPPFLPPPGPGADGS